MRKRFARPSHFFRSPDMPFGAQWFFTGGEGGGGSGGGSTEPPPRQNPADVVAKYSGDAIRMAGQIVDVERDNFHLREDKRKLNRQLEELGGKVPADGSVILTGDAVKAWDSYQKLGKPDAVATELQAGRSAQARVTEVEREQTLEEAARIARLKPGVLKLVAKDADIQIREVDTVDPGGGTVKEKRPFVITYNGGQESAIPLRDHFEAQGQDVMETLDAGDGIYEAVNSRMAAYGPHNGGTPFPAQGTGCAAAQKNSKPADDLINKRYVRPVKTQA